MRQDHSLKSINLEKNLKKYEKVQRFEKEHMSFIIHSSIPSTFFQFHHHFLNIYNCRRFHVDDHPTVEETPHEKKVTRLTSPSRN